MTTPEHDDPHHVETRDGARDRQDAPSGIRSLASRYFLCGDLLVVAVALLVLAVGTFVGVLTSTDLSAVDAIPAGAVLYLVVALVALALLRVPARTEQRQHGSSATGFAEVRRVRGLLRSGGPLTPADQEVADDLARVCARRAAERSSVTRVAVVVALLVAGALVAGLNGHDANLTLGAATLGLVGLAVLVTERRRATAVRADLLGRSAGRR